MENPKHRLVEAAVRPLADNAEMQVSATHFLEELVRDDAAAAERVVKRWEELDSKKGRLTWRLALFSLLAIVSATILTVLVSRAINIRQAYNLVSGHSLTPPTLRKVGKSTLTPEQKLILYGDETQSSKAGKAKGLWDRYPENLAYFSQYAEAYLSENDKLPDDFLTQARRLDPQNAWFLYLAAGVEAKDCVKRQTQSATAKAAGEMPEIEVLNPARLDRALQLVREARNLSICNDYKKELMQQMIPLLAQGNLVERLISVGHLAGLTAADLITLRHLGNAIAAKAVVLGREKKTAEFQELISDAEAFVSKTLTVEPSTLIAGLVHRVNASSVSQGLAAGARQLELHPEAQRHQAIYDRLRQVRESHKNSSPLIDGFELRLKSGVLFAIVTPMVYRQAANPPVITDADVRPGRMMEHEILSMISAVAAFFLLGIYLIFAWVFRFRQSKMLQGIAARLESLLRPVDWFWIIGLGVVIPLLVVMLINRSSPLGGRDFSVYGLNFMMPTLHFIAAVFLIVIVPVLIARWRLGKRVAVFGLVWGKPWIGWSAVISTIAFICAIGYAVPFSSMDQVRSLSNLVLLPKIWMLTIAFKTIFAMPARLLMSGIIARVMVPVYATAMLLMISLIPVFNAAQQHWFEQDTLMSLDPNNPGMGTYEYKLAGQLLKETREIVRTTTSP